MVAGLKSRGQVSNQLINFISRVVKMGGNTQSAKPRRRDNTMVIENLIESLSRKPIVTTTNHRGLFAGAPGTDNPVSLL